MTDDAYERLAQRNAELEAEKAALLGEVESLNEHIEALQEKQVAETCACSHDYPTDVCLGHSPMYRKMRDERDALAAHVERLTDLLNELPDVMPVTPHLPMARIKGEYLERVDVAVTSGLTISLASLKAKSKAEEVGRIADALRDDVEGAYFAPFLDERAAELHRQAEAGECRCTFAQKTVGDGCAACNPELPSNWEVDYVHPGPDR